MKRAQILKHGSALFFVCGAGLASLGCNGRGGECVVTRNDCAPLYEPTFDNIHQRTLLPTCAVGSSCHSEEGAKAGLVFTTADQSYEALIGSNGSDPMVLVGDPDCSLLVQRLESIENPMPPGQPLSEAERCVMVQWIAQGAPR